MKLPCVIALVLVTVSLAAGCAADAAPMETDVVVIRAGLASPVAEGAHCVLRMQPAFRQGVNCQVILRCGEEDLFGGRRVGGYAVCDTSEGAFVSATDDERRTDGDPAVQIDLPHGSIGWQGPHDGEDAELRIEGPTRPTSTWE